MHPPQEASVEHIVRPASQAYPLALTQPQIMASGPAQIFQLPGQPEAQADPLGAYPPPCGLAAAPGSLWPQPEQNSYPVAQPGLWLMPPALAQPAQQPQLGYLGGFAGPSAACVPPPMAGVLSYSSLGSSGPSLALHALPPAQVQWPAAAPYAAHSLSYGPYAPPSVGYHYPCYYHY